MALHALLGAMHRIALLTAALLPMSGCSFEPGYQPRTGVLYTCHTEEPASGFAIEFQPGTAILSHNGSRVELKFVPDIWPRFADLYTGSGYALTLDPEALLTTHDGKVLGPCQL
jgi:hypothetical protein